MKRKLSLPQITAAAIVFLGTQGCVLATPGFAQTTGVSHPEDLTNDVASPPPDSAPAPIVARVSSSPSNQDHYVKPSPDVPEAADQDTAATPALCTRTPLPAPLTSRAVKSDQDAQMIVTDDVNSGIVTEVPVGPNELPTGTVLRAELQNPISTTATRAGSRFVATLTKDVGRHDVVMLPAGTLITGRITLVHGGHAISGPAAIRLQPERVSLPDGTNYRLDAEVIDLDHAADSHVNSEGTIVDNSHPKATLAALGLTTSSAAVAGAVVGGGVGAAVGAGIGAGVGAVWWLKRDRQETLPQGTSIVFGLDNSLQLTPAAR
jgi:hypothetical protein